MTWGPWGWSGSSPSSVGISAARLCMGHGARSHCEAGSERAHCSSLEPGCSGGTEKVAITMLLQLFCLHFVSTVPQQGKLFITTEFGKMLVEPNEICVIQVRADCALPVAQSLTLERASSCIQLFMVCQQSPSIFLYFPARNAFQCGGVWRDQRLHPGGVWGTLRAA